MSEQTTTQAEQTTEFLESDPLLEDGDWAEAEHAPINRRRGLTGMLTPFRVGLLCLLILVAGFIGGVLVQKGSGDGGSSSAIRSGPEASRPFSAAVPAPATRRLALSRDGRRRRST